MRFIPGHTVLDDLQVRDKLPGKRSKKEDLAMGVGAMCSVMKKVADINWAEFLPTMQILRNRDVAPNQLKRGEIGDRRIGALVVAQSQNGDDFALGQRGLEEVRAALREKRIAEGYVVLVDRTGGFVNAKPVEEVAAIVADFELRPGKYVGWGPFWWITAEFTRPGYVVVEDEHL
jgi:hypothetical protein